MCPWFRTRAHGSIIRPFVILCRFKKKCCMFRRFLLLKVWVGLKLVALTRKRFLEFLENSIVK